MADDGTCSQAPRDLPTLRPNERRPSLYAATRLTRFVHNVKERLKRGIKRRDLHNDHVDLRQADLQALALGDLDRTRVNCKNVDKGADNHGARPPLAQLDIKACLLLEQIDRQTPAGEPKTSNVATQDHLFLAYSAKRITKFKEIDDLRHIYDLTSLLLDKLSRLLGRAGNCLLPVKLFSSVSESLSGQEKSVANLDHILRCLRQAALERLIYYGLESLEADVLHWRQYWQQQKHLNHGWFSEWPNGRRPLSTTWPWNIRPSLVVLWGVCWMFYDNSTRSSRNLSQEFEGQNSGSFWARPAPQSATPNQQNIAAFLTGSNDNPYQDPSPAWVPQEISVDHHTRRASRISEYSTTLPGYQPSLPTTLSPYIAYYPAVSTSDPVPDPPLVWPQIQGSHSLPLDPQNSGTISAPILPLSHRHSAPSALIPYSPGFSTWQSPQLNLPQHSQQPQILAPRARRIESRGGAQPYQAHQATPQGDLHISAFSPNLRLPMGDMQNYPSPHSDVSRDETRSSCVSVLPSNAVSPNMMYAASPSTDSRLSRPSVGRTTEEPPRNLNGQITCSHPKCARDPPVFSRKCEWTKHMDKHTRPYVCTLQGCEKIQGFTYSGGLSRHQREVHRQHGGPKASYMCPHKDCKRSTGNGFSRKENLQEHIRRVHRQVTDIETERQPGNERSVPSFIQPRRRRRQIDSDDDEPEPISHEPRKRRRNNDDDDDSDASAPEFHEEGLSAQIKRLRKELQEKDERLKKLEQTVERLTKQSLE